MVIIGKIGRLQPKARLVIVTGQLFGDEGKGTAVDYFAHQLKPNLVMRYNGGCQAGHGVTNATGQTMVFNQFGSGTFHGVPTYLPKDFLLDPWLLDFETHWLKKFGVSAPLNLLKIDAAARVVWPAHVLLNHLKEMALDKTRHGSVGRGISECCLDIHNPAGIVVADLLNERILRTKLEQLIPEKIAAAQSIIENSDQKDELNKKYQEYADFLKIDFLMKALLGYGRKLRPVIVNGEEFLASVMKPGATIVAEGAQGVLLDKDFGLFPHVTPTTTLARGLENVFGQSLEELAANSFEILKIGAIRPYLHCYGLRPLPTEIRPEALTPLIRRFGGKGMPASKNLSAQVIRQFSAKGGRRSGQPISSPATALAGLADNVSQHDWWSEAFRIGWLDSLLLRAACAMNRTEKLFVTNLDRLSGLPEIPVSVGYKIDGEKVSGLEHLLKYQPCEDDQVEISDFRLPETLTSPEERAVLDQLLLWEKTSARWQRKKRPKNVRAGRKIEERRQLTNLLKQVQPVYTVLPGWGKSIIGVRSFSDLPPEAQNYLKFLEEQAGVPVGYVSVGPTCLDKFEV